MGNQDNLDQSQKKSNALRVMVALAVFCLLGFGAWQLWNTQQPKQQSEQSKKDNNVTLPVESKYLEIAELGIKVKLNAGLEDLVYNYDEEYNAEYPGQKRVDLSTTNLTTLSNDSCAANSNASPVGTIVKTKTLPNDNYAPDGKKSFKIGEDYVYWLSPQAPCSTDANVEQAAQAARADFLEAFKTVQSISVAN